MWICLFVVVSLGRANPFTTTVQPDVGIESIANVSVAISPTSEATSSTAETTDTDQSDTEGDDASYLVAILHKNNFLLGAGAIIGEKWILATAFQMGAFKADQLRVRVGSSSALSGGKVLAVDQVFPHPMFKQFNNDVALLRTAEAVEQSDAVKFIPVAVAPPSIGDSAVLWMWDRKTRAQKNQADILPVSDCRAFYPDFELTESNICAVLDHVLLFQVSLYGSPLVYNQSLVGLYMGMEANMFKPSLCSNLSPLVGWVHAMMKNETATQLLFPLSD